MTRTPDEARFRAWLAARAPRSAPAGLLERSLAAIDARLDAPRNRGWSPYSLVPIVSGTLVALAMVVAAALVLGLLPPGPAPAGGPTLAPNGSTAVASASASASMSPTASATATATPGATPTGIPTASPGPSSSPPAFTLTFRLVLSSIPADTTGFGLTLDGFTTPPWPEGIEGGREFFFCGGPNAAACQARTYQATFTWTAKLPIEWSLLRHSATGYEHVERGSHASDGSTVVLRYPLTAPSTSPAPISCAGAATATVGSVELSYWMTDYRAAVDLCLQTLSIYAEPTAPPTGTVTVTIDGRPIWSLDLADWEQVGVGVPRSNQVERQVTFSQPIALRENQVVGLTIAGCPDCRTLSILIVGWTP